MAANIQANVDLTHLNTLGLPSKAGIFAEVTSLRDVAELYEQGFFDGEPVFVLGSGSNVLLKNSLIRPVLKVSIHGISLKEEAGENVVIEAGAGVNWHSLVAWVVERGYGGIENLALIPGTVGAAPIQNIGAYGVELEQVFEAVEFFDLRDGSQKTFFHNDCLFGYRDSIFKRDLKGKIVITKVALRLQKENHRPIISYYALENYLAGRGITAPSIKDVFDAVIAIRKSKLPDPELIGNAGSFFKNPVVDSSVFKTIKKSYPELPAYALENGQVKIPAGWLIETAGWKGKRVGNVGTYDNQALVIVNHGGATGAEVFGHAMRIKKSVSRMFGIELVPEVNIVE